MKIEYYYQPRAVTLEEFADQHGLIMEVHQRKEHDYYAQFKDCGVKQGSMWVGTYGDGRNQSEAIENYRKEISGQTLIFRNETYISVPVLKGTY